jgi:SAM-dependent methyltransferase
MNVMRLFSLIAHKSMHPKRIRKKEEINRISRMLESFYVNRSDDYGLMDRPESDYQDYADVVTRWTPKNGNVLDLGCGTYRTPLLLQGRGFQTIGCDLFSEKQCRQYQKKVGQDGPRFVSYAGKRLPFDYEAFDTVATLCMMEHVADVHGMLSEIKRILKPGGCIVIIGPNMSGPHRVILAMKNILGRKGRYWQFQNVINCIVGGMKMMFWSLLVLISKKPLFLYVYPWIEKDKIKFELPDDDAIHLNAPLSYKKWFRQNGFRLNQYNRRMGDSKFARVFNTLFPALATKVQIVAQKR